MHRLHLGQSPRRRVIVFARAPERGRVKTRLAAELGEAAALDIYRWLGKRTLEVACATPYWELEVRYTPATATDAVAEWLGSGLQMRPQSEGDLGARMRGAISDALAEGVESVVIIGTDCPTLDAAVLERAFDDLHRADVVLGPALDGGYYLIATRRDHAALFENIPWSSPDTLRRTLSAASEAGLRVSLLDSRADIDTSSDWRRHLATSAGRLSRTPPFVPPDA